MEYVQPVGAAADAPYLDANPSGGVEGSPVPAAAIEHPMRELVALITDAGLTPSDADLEQVASAVRTLMQKQSSCVSNADGTADAITGSYTPGIAALTNGMTLYVRAASANATTTPTFTPASGTIAAKTIVKGPGAALTAGDVAGAGHWIDLQYDATLDKWVLLNPAKGISSASAAIQGASKNLRASANGTSANVSVSADEIIVESAANDYQTLRSVSLTIAGTSVGANALDSGTIAASTWYSLWAIWNGTTTAGLISLSATAPTLPAGYTHKARVGWVRTDGTANKFPLGFVQFGRDVQYQVASGSNLTALPIPISGVQGNISTPTWASASLVNYVPSTASAVDIVASMTSTSGTIIAAPNNSYGAYNSAVNPPPLVNGQSGGTPNTAGRRMLLESTSIYFAGQNADHKLLVSGWQDSL